MREVDQALARVYASSATPATNPSRPASRAGAGRGSLPAPHFPVESSGVPAVPVREPGQATLCWPETVLSLERAHGQRFEALADRLVEIRDQQQLKVLLFTSCHRAEGRTTLVLALARALARRPGRTLLVDADLSGPMLSRQLGLSPAAGLDDVVESGLALAEAVVDAPDDHLAILPLRAPVARPREFLADPSWACLMARLRREFDLVLMDGSPLFTGLSAAVLHRSVDAAILVHNRALTGERALLRAREVLDAGGVPLLGLAETFV